MDLSNFTKRIAGKFRRRIDGSASAQTAYQTLQRGVRRYQEKQRLLSNRELSLIQACRNRLVLSAPERELIENSEAYLDRRTQSGRRLALIALAVIVLGVSVQMLWPFSTGNADKLSHTLAVSNDKVEEAKAVPAEKLNRSPRRQTSNLPIARERRRKFQEETQATAPLEEPAPSPAPEAGMPAYFELPGPFSIQEEPLAGLPEPVAVPKPAAPEPAETPDREEAPEEETEKPASKPGTPAEELRSKGKPAEQPETETGKVKRRFSYQETVNTSYGKVMIVQEAGKWGLADISGKYLLDPEYDLIKAFHTQRGLFLIERSGKRGIAQAQGEVILYPFFEHIKSYHLRESLLVVANNGKVGVYDEKEKEFAIGLEFQDICCLADGLFGVQMTDGKWGFIDRKGNMIIPPIYDALESPFEDGRALVQKGGRKYYIDKAGNVFPYKGES